MAAGRGQPEALLSCAIRLLDGNRVGALAAQPTGMRANDGSWHYAALTYGDDTATVDLAETAAVTPDKLPGDKLPPSGRMLTVFSQEEPEPSFQALSGGAGQRHIRVQRSWRTCRRGRSWRSALGSSGFKYRSTVQVDGKLAKHTTRPLVVNNKR